MIRADDFYCSIALSGEARIDFFVAADIESIITITHRGGDDLKSSSNCLQVTSASQDGAVMILLGS